MSLFHEFAVEYDFGDATSGDRDRNLMQILMLMCWWGSIAAGIRHSRVEV
jgi:hypothetical protein